MDENIAANRCVEGRVGSKVVIRADHEFDPMGLRLGVARATSMARPSGSIPMTAPVGPTAPARSRDTSLTPHPISSTRTPGSMPQFADQPPIEWRPF
jgi:hypothetical protein